MKRVSAKADRIEAILPDLERLVEACALCGHRCGANRLLNARGLCRTTSASGRRVRVSSHTLHFGEEPMLVGRGGSGTVFFTHCNLRCVFCQNHQISQQGLGEDLASRALSRVFFELQDQGAENINLVTPTHVMYPILLALRDAYRDGLALPLVYNTNGYDSLELIALLDGIVDIYLPDMKYMDAATAEKYSSARDYPETAKAAIKAMYEQVGGVVLEGDVARRGLIIRHLLLPDNLAGSYDFLLWLRDESMRDVTLSLMSQYSPQHRAQEFPELAARISRRDYAEVVRFALDLGFAHLLTQGLDSSEVYLPDFEKDEPFEQ